MAALTEEALKAMAQEAGEALTAEVKDWETMSASSYQALAQVKRSDLTEVKSFAAPPAGVKKTLEAALVALGHPSTTWAQFRGGSWGQARKVLASTDTFVNTLVTLIRVVSLPRCCRS